MALGSFGSLSPASANHWAKRAKGSPSGCNLVSSMIITWGSNIGFYSIDSAILRANFNLASTDLYRHDSPCDHGVIWGSASGFLNGLMTMLTRKILVAALVGGLGIAPLAGCAQGGGSYSDESVGTVLGAVGGAAAGAAIGNGNWWAIGAG